MIVSVLSIEPKETPKNCMISSTAIMMTTTQMNMNHMNTFNREGIGNPVHVTNDQRTCVCTCGLFTIDMFISSSIDDIDTLEVSLIFFNIVDRQNLGEKSTQVFNIALTPFIMFYVNGGKEVG